MAYSGFLIKVGNYTIPHNWIRAETYSITKNGQDLDSYRDANGVLHREALEHWVAKAEFETPPLKTNTEVVQFMSSISSQYISAVEKKAIVTLYIPEMDEYVTQEMYVPDIQFPIYQVDGNIIKYNQFRVAFIGY